MRGLKDGAVARKPVQHFLMSVVRLPAMGHERGAVARKPSTFPDVRGQVEDIWEIEAQQPLIISTAETGATLTPPQHYQRTLSDRFTSSLFGLSVCLNVPRTSSTPSEALLCRLKHQSASSSVGKRTSDEQKGVKNDTFLLVSFPCEIRGSNEGSEGRSCCAEARPTFPDVRGQVEDIILGNREAQN
ncbi:hypothetical protein TNIN_372841 [Trichonephila inaurata madagascariensis]|uniref:Uncharacterized protein n=1 Tax=Trichonephila inaurata madagascariensis TaxID=2747483 RepID=A0A8X6WTD2_9ARAC|nr:hypothetical protein TNIN_372841 [Trichonephila inaurata madagascariensis]